MNKQAKKTINKAKKIEVVAELSQKVAKAKAIVLTNYQGLTHVQLETFKKLLQKSNAELVVSKNSLLKIALGKEMPLDDAVTEGPTATLFAYEDVVTPLKDLAKMIKDFKLPVIKVGIVEGQVVSADQVTKLSTLPSRDVLIAQFVGGLKAPIYGLHRALQWNLQKFVLTLNAISQTKSQ